MSSRVNPFVPEECSQSTFIRVMADANMFSFCKKKDHEVKEMDPERRLNFCNSVLGMAVNDRNLHKKIVFTGNHFSAKLLILNVSYQHERLSCTMFERGSETI